MIGPTLRNGRPRVGVWIEPTAAARLLSQKYADSHRPPHATQQQSGTKGDPAVNLLHAVTADLDEIDVDTHPAGTPGT